MTPSMEGEISALREASNNLGSPSSATAITSYICHSHLRTAIPSPHSNSEEGKAVAGTDKAHLIPRKTQRGISGAPLQIGGATVSQSEAMASQKTAAELEPQLRTEQISALGFHSSFCSSSSIIHLLNSRKEPFSKWQCTKGGLE